MALSMMAFTSPSYSQAVGVDLVSQLGPILLNQSLVACGRCVDKMVDQYLAWFTLNDITKLFSPDSVGDVPCMVKLIVEGKDGWNPHVLSREMAMDQFW
mmetsp:Transcript_26600/g.42156  ORF Transcript_26600/g.42156 Transcript_26600/m.42156 type:complete len:99 (-) Transcript_26600:205-501(-)